MHPFRPLVEPRPPILCRHQRLAAEPAGRHGRAKPDGQHGRAVTAARRRRINAFGRVRLLGSPQQQVRFEAIENVPAMRCECDVTKATGVREDSGGSPKPDHAH